MLLHLLKTAWGRFTAGLTAMLMLCWLTGAEFTGLIEWEPTIAFIVAVLAWAYSCLPDAAEPPAATPSASAHDVALYDRFQQEFDDELQLFLRDQDFAAAFEISRLSKLRAIAATWHGPNYQFDDAELAAQFADLLEGIREFSSSVALGTQMVGGSQFAKMPWNEDDEEGSRHRQKALNDAADHLVKMADEFLIAGRRRLKTGVQGG